MWPAERPFGGAGRGWHHYAGDVAQATGGLLNTSNVTWGGQSTATYANAATLNQ
jgi:hypothetical protein